jgi:Icc-related predicted phosphoesterase
MRLLVVADLHYALPQYDWVMDVASDFDAVIIAGDHLDTTSLVDFRAQTVVVQKYLGRLKDRTQLITCSGNHDLDSRNEAGEKVTRWILRYRSEGVPTDGDCFVIGDTLFTICPWWDGPIVREAISRQLAADAPKRLRRWIWVHHAPPDHSPVSWGGGRYFGDVDLVRWIGEHRPDIVFSGHVHQSPFVKDGSWVDRIGETWVFNAGHQFGAPPAHIIVDTEQDMAHRFSAAGNQYVKLGEPLVRPVGVLHAMPEWLTSSGPAGVPNPA